MLVWLASYPRSGNTLLRIVLNRSFGIGTVSFYGDEFVRGEVADIVGQQTATVPRGQIAQAARESAELVVVKTHELPLSHVFDKTIYVVRDGRSSLVSYRHYINRTKGTRQRHLVEVVLAAGTAPWGQHVTAWALSGRPDTLLVRYEALAAGDDATLDAIAAHIGKPVLARGAVAFDELNKVAPGFFRKGSDAANVAELTATCPNVYELVHGPVAAKIGYATGHALDAAAAQAEIAAWYDSFAPRT